MSELSKLKNIGATLEQRLHTIGIYNRRDLSRIGAAAAYRLLSARHPGKHLPVCYNLYSLQGALEDRHWRSLTDNEKSALLAKV